MGQLYRIKTFSYHWYNCSKILEKAIEETDIHVGRYKENKFKEIIMEHEISLKS